MIKMVYNFKLADIGEGIVEGEVSRWYVKVGDVVKENQPLVEIITEKVTVELPSPADGTITKIGPDAGKIVKVGEVIVVIDDGKEDKDIEEIMETPELGKPTLVKSNKKEEKRVEKQIEELETTKTASKKEVKVLKRKLADTKKTVAEMEKAYEEDDIESASDFLKRYKK